MPKAKKQSKDRWQTKKLDDYIKEGLPILPELQCKYKPPLDTISSKIRQRIELSARAYSAAVYAQKNQLNRPQKNLILNAFNAECFTALQGVSDAVEFAKGNPAAERHALLKDYQSWMNQITDLLKEALYALDYDKWVQRLVSIPPEEALSRKNGKLQPSETFCNALGQRGKVFDPDLYFSKFSEFFPRQMQLEQRISLAIGITGDWIAALIAARNKKKITKLTDFIRDHCEDTPSVSSKANRIHEFVKKRKIKFMPKPINNPRDNQTKLYDERELREVWPKLKEKIKSLPNLKN